MYTESFRASPSGYSVEVSQSTRPSNLVTPVLDSTEAKTVFLIYPNHKKKEALKQFVLILEADMGKAQLMGRWL